MRHPFPLRFGRLLLRAIFLTFAALGAWAFIIEPSQLTISKYHLLLSDQLQTPILDGLKIAILTDLHVGAPHMSITKLRTVVERTNAEVPDLIVLLGDFVIHGVVGGQFVEPEAIAQELKLLRSRSGTIAILGNHDWWYDGEHVRKALQQVGIRVLENEAIRINRGKKYFWVLGLADLWTRTPNLSGPLSFIRDEQPVIVLTHSPDIFPEIPPRVSLTLAGHTHGGQVDLPVVGRPIVPSKFGQRYAYGHIIEEGRHLFVSSGIGTSMLPVRFRVPPEIVILTLDSNLKTEKAMERPTR